MKRDVMQAAGLEIYTEIAIIIFFALFVAVVLKVMLSKTKAFDDAANLPLNDGTEVHS